MPMSPLLSNSSPVRRKPRAPGGLMKAPSHKHEINKVVLFQKAVALFRFISTKKAPDDRTFLRMTKGTPLHLLASRSDIDDTWITTKLQNYINLAFKINGVPGIRAQLRGDHGGHPPNEI